MSSTYSGAHRSTSGTQARHQLESDDTNDDDCTGDHALANSGPMRLRGCLMLAGNFGMTRAGSDVQWAPLRTSSYCSRIAFNSFSSCSFSRTSTYRSSGRVLYSCPLTQTSKNMSLRGAEFEGSELEVRVVSVGAPAREVSDNDPCCEELEPKCARGGTDTVSLPKDVLLPWSWLARVLTAAALSKILCLTSSTPPGAVSVTSIYVY